jgi:predicted metal-dependent enzyme (double-stranded beta helix superfamily)
MKRLLTILAVLVISLLSFTAQAQLTVNQAITTTGPYKVGDTISIRYTVAKDTTTPRYFWLRYRFNNKALAYVSTTFSQGSSSQTFYTGWSNYGFTPSSTKPATSLYEQYQISPWAYAVNSDWNVGQLTVQRTDASIDGVIATQRYVVLAKSDYTDIHKLDLAYAYNTAGTFISPITTTGTPVSLGTVTGGLAAFNVRVAFPSTDTSVKYLSARLFPLNTNGTVNMTATPIATAAFNAQGIASFTTPKVGDKFGVVISPATGTTYLDNVVTVSDAYKAFLQNASVGITGTTNYFQYPTLEKKIGNVTIANSTFGNDDAYNLFSYVMGIDVAAKARIPSKTATSFNFLYGKRDVWHTGVLTDNIVEVTSATQTNDFAYAYGGDLDYSNSTDPASITGAVTGMSVNTIETVSKVKSNSVAVLNSIAYESAKLANATLSLVSSISGTSVVLTGTLTADNLAGLQVIMNYDDSKLTLDNVVFDTGNTMTNFSTHNNGRLTFGSIDQNKTSKIKVGTPYKLMFTSKVPLQNTTGLFFTVLSDAVDANGNKVNLIVE